MAQILSFFAPKYTGDERLDGKTAVITGCNTGIGKFTALDFCRRGCRVVMACRSISRAEEAKKDILERLKDEEDIGELAIRQLDLSSLKSVRQCAKQILSTELRIDLLVNNAGIMMCPKELTEDGFEKQFATNHLGHFLFTLLLLPRVISSAPARIINLTSVAHRYATGNNFEDYNFEKEDYSPIQAYCRSKLANILFTKELARTLKGKNVTVYAVHPGLVGTELDRNLDATYFRGIKFLCNWFFWWFYRSAEQGAQTTLYCALDPNAAKETGRYYYDCKNLEPTESAEDTKAAEKLWHLSLKLVQLENFDPFTTKDKGPKNRKR